jgi:hypothetical protein
MNTKAARTVMLAIGISALNPVFYDRAAWACPQVPVSVPRIEGAQIKYLGFDRDQGYRNVSFSGSGSYDPDGGPIVEYTWSYQASPFPDENTHHQCSFTKTYYEPGAYTEIKLWVKDDEEQTNWEYCHLYLVEARLDVSFQGQWMQDPDEYDKGAFIPVNLDDDNGNGIPDVDDPSTTQYENDLLLIYLSMDPLCTYLEGQGQVKLEATSGGAKIKVWESFNRQSQVTLPATWDVGDVGFPLYVEGIEGSALKGVKLKMTYSRGGEQLCEDNISITVVDVTSVEWVGVVPPGDDETNLSNDNPSSHGGGWRIFPGKNDPDGPIHDKINVKATINVTMPPGMTWKVYFKPFDMDDPTQNYYAEEQRVNVVDPNDTATAFNGGDNKDKNGNGTALGIAPAEAIYGVVASGTNYAQLTGVGDDIYEITDRNPGNNFRIVAQSLPGYIDVVQVDTGSEKKGLDLKEGPSGGTVPDQYKGPLLSVWRKLHVEFDKMDNAPADQFFGERDGTSSTITTNTLTSQGNPGWAADSLRGAVLEPDGTEAPNTLTHSTNWEVIGNGNNVVTVKTDYTTDTFDNDGQNGVDDDGEEWEMTPQNPSNKPFAIETDDAEWMSDACKPPTNAAAIASLNDCYNIAYIKCFEAEGNTHHTFDFRRNCENEDQMHGNQLDVADDYAADFWAVAIFWSYEAFSKSDTDPPCQQHGRKTVYGDDDPEREGAPNQDGNWRCIRGKAVDDLHTKGGPTADVYIESTRDDGEYSVMFVAAHEIGHLLGLGHAPYGGPFPEEFLEDDNGIMAWVPVVMCWHNWQPLWDPQIANLYFRPSNNNIQKLRTKANPF